MNKLTVEILFNLNKKDFTLSLLSAKKGLKKQITTPELSRPGLALAGYLDTFAHDRLQILGETEIKYLKTLSPSKRYDAIKKILSQFDITGFIVSKGMYPSKELIFLADEYNIPVLQSTLTTINLYHGLNIFLQDWFAPSKSIHATLVDVAGVGILITGKSGIGKSECALELISRGHRLIADDVVNIKKRINIIMGEANKKIGHFMEIRGIGLLDIEKMFGIRAIRMQKRIETQVELIPWRHNMDYERIGLKERFNRILDVGIPIIYLPVSPGKSIAVIIEVIAMNHILKAYGYNAAEVFNSKIQEELKRKESVRKYLETDKE
ncbi:MAG: HPr(Ser) kinase/phosphatase [Candidatus Cloacimonetes bacterium]|nr:HPr(Ser) kinase/phosphatase [Candidatus Cloacimonadota bacterium]MBL7085981.1 HPr(Ser) kinase/phosphatase [Candidatus Cloacimonadota bacterium]